MVRTMFLCQTVQDAHVGPVLSNLPTHVFHNAEASCNGGVVLGLAAPDGHALSLIDAVVGKVRTAGGSQ